MFRRSQIGQRLRPPDQPQRGGVDADADAGVAFFHAADGGLGHADARRPSLDRLAPPLAGNGQVLAQLAQLRLHQRRQGGQGDGAFWHDIDISFFA